MLLNYNDSFKLSNPNLKLSLRALRSNPQMPRQTQKRKKSKHWAQRHLNDTYVKKANQSGYRARAAFKLEEINTRHKLIKPGMRILDLGAAPGSWSQLSSQITGTHGLVVAVDLLPIQPIKNVQFIQGDFCNTDIQAQIIVQLGNKAADLIICDMSPDLTGIRITDQANMENLLQSVFNSLENLLNPNGDLLIKVFEGQLLADLRKSLNSLFKKVINIKPDASRKQSREFYLLARDFKAA